MTGSTRRHFLKTTAAAALATGAGYRPAWAAEEVLKVGVIHMGAISDTGWEHYQAQAWRALETAYPGKVKVTVLENIAQIQDCERLFRQLSTQGNKLIFGTTFSQYASLKKLAPTLTGSHFECCAGIEAGRNLGVFEARQYEGTYLTGIAAGRMTKSNILGWVGAFPVPQVIYSLNAFLLGARSVNPAATLKVVWANAWVDPAKEKDAVAALVAQGADVLSGSPNTPVQGLAAEEKGVWSIGSTGDFSAYVRKKQLTSFELDWSSAHLGAAKAVIEGNWKPESRWLGLGAGGFLKMTTSSPDLPASVAAEMKAAEAAIVSGTLKPFAGPLKDQSGAPKVAAGAALPDQEIRTMTWLVEGVQGTLPRT
ncbi:BMP family ABC transporter substrate-binding protein [Chelatococcus reniformis]|uniref:BMP family ABC transporter substrate-binding protein n=1 Tax=Chelatococcus reniformis TaxID=1494448 RepID=A0A916UV47_9HYPH|nr:BMP family ABC transporter substrate-binding protein [Chelatococcus reniformis]GGC89380.1 BMP family ABC transporter substrate-binding protein [Chelatococcus reniformis]